MVHMYHLYCIHQPRISLQQSRGFVSSQFYKFCFQIFYKQIFQIKYVLDLCIWKQAFLTGEEIMHLVAIILMMIYGVPHEGGYSMDEPFLFKFELWFESADQYVTKLRVE